MYWGPTHNKFKRTRERNLNLKKPHLLNKMVEISSNLSKDFDYVRVDLMICNKKLFKLLLEKALFFKITK